MKTVAMLRAVNVGGRNRMTMSALEACFRELGAEQVRTYIQSGNVVYEGALTPRQIEEKIRETFGFSAPVVLRSAEQMAQVLRGNPFPEAPSERLQVFFLANPPQGALNPEQAPGERFEVRGSEIYAWCPQGFGNSRITAAWVDRSLKTMATARNWKTVGVLAEWSQEASSSR